MKSIDEILSFLKDEHNLAPYHGPNGTEFFFYTPSTHERNLHLISVPSTIQNKDFCLKPYHNLNDKSIATFLNAVLNKDLSVKNDFKELFKFQNFKEYFSNFRVNKHEKLFFVEYMFKNDISAIDFILSERVFSSMNYRYERSDIIAKIHENLPYIQDKQWIPLAKQISEINTKNLNSQTVKNIVSIFKDHPECIDILNSKPLFKQIINNKEKGFYFIDEYYNDSLPGIINIDIKAISNSSFNGYLQNLNKITQLVVECSNSVYPCEVFFTEKNMRLLSSAKSKKGQDKKMVRNHNMMITYYNENQDIAYKFSDFFRFMLENIFNEIFEADDRNSKTQDIIKHIKIKKENYLLEFDIPIQEENTSKNVMKF